MTEVMNNIADKWFGWELAILWQAAVLIAIVLVIDLLIRRWVWPQMRYALWLLVLVKLILPPTLTSPASFTAEIPFLAQKAVKVQINKPEAMREIGGATSPGEAVASPVKASPENASSYTQTHDEPMQGNMATPPAEAVPAGEALSWKAYTFFVWSAGIVVLSTWLIIRLTGLRREHLKDGRQANLPDRFKELLVSTAQKLNLKKVPHVILTNRVCCPAVFGIFVPVLLMPADKLKNMTRQDTEHVLLHELAHIKRGDLFVHSVYMTLQIAYWFNPLLWLIRKQLQNLRELCCDATVAKILKEKTLNYRETLLETARQLLAEPVETGLGLLGLFENSNRLVERLRWLEKKTWKDRPLRILAILVLVGVMLGCVLPMAKAASKPPEFIIKGTVTDAETGRPIAGAKVGDNREYNDGKFCTVTDSKGNYEYKTWYEEHFTKCEAAGYKTEKKILLTKFIGSEKEKVIDFALEKGPSEGLEPSLIPQEFVGHWKGKGEIIVNWTKQRWLGIDIEIMPNGAVKGRVGDSELKDAALKSNRSWLGKQLNVKTDWMIQGDLIGPVIKSEGIKREYIKLLFDDIGEDGKIKGGFHTSGWHIGNKDTMVMSGTAMVLEKVAVSKSDNRGFSATLANGVTVELAGVCEYPSQGKQWWRPDGTLLEKPPYRTMGGKLTHDEGYSDYEFVLRTNGPGDTSFTVQVPGGRHGTYTGTPYGQDGNRAENLRVYTANQPGGKDKTSVRVGATADKWQTRAVYKPDEKERTYDFDSQSVAFNSPHEDSGDTILPLTHNLNKPEVKVDIRVVAVKKDGGIWFGSCSGYGGNVLHSSTYQFKSLPLEEIRHFEFQTRPYEWVEFKNVSLKPNFKTGVQIEIEQKKSEPAADFIEGQMLVDEEEIESLSTVLQKPAGQAEAGGSPLTNKKGPQLLKEAESAMRQFQQALKEADWPNALAYCSSKIKTKAEEYDSTEAFFKDVLPIEEITSLSEFRISGSGRTGSGSNEVASYNSEITLKYPDSKYQLYWNLSAVRSDESWTIEFPTKPLNIWLKHENLKMMSANGELKLDSEKTRTGFDVRLVPLSENLVIGQPMLFRVEMKNISSETLGYTHTSFMVNNPMVIKDSSGSIVPYIDTDYQTSMAPEFVEPGESIVLSDNYDVRSQYHITKPGKYTFQFRGLWNMKPSNIIEVDVKSGQLLPLEVIVEKLTPILPPGWKLTRRPAESLYPKNEQTIFIHLFSEQHRKSKGAGIGLFLYINPGESLFTDRFQSELPKILGGSPLGLVYIKSLDAEQLWPNYEQQICKALDIEKMGFDDLDANTLMEFALGERVFRYYKGYPPDVCRNAFEYFIAKTDELENREKLRKEFAGKIVEKVHEFGQKHGGDLHDCWIWASFLGPLGAREQTLLLLKESPRFSCHYGPELVTSLGQCGTIEDIPALIDAIDKENEGAGAVVNKALEKITGVKMPLTERGDTDKAAWQKWWKENKADVQVEVEEKRQKSEDTESPFGPVIEITVNDESVGRDMYIDFDSGKLATLPPDISATDKKAIIDWIEKTGVDAKGAVGAGTWGLINLGMTVLPEPNDRWDEITAKFLEEMTAFIILPILNPVGDSDTPIDKWQFPSTFVFRTRQGAMGVLQITGFNDEPRGVKIRYKKCFKN